MSDAPTPPPLATPPPAPRPRRWDWRPKVRWFAAEYLIVVLGVLTAVGINAWWGDRQQAQEERRLLTALLAEADANEARLARIVAFHGAVKETATTLLAVSADPTSEVSADSADQLLTDVSWWSSYTTLESAVLDAAVQDGQLDVVQTDSLRRLLGTWHTELAAVRVQGEQERAHYETVWVPLLRAETELAQVSNRAETVPGSSDPYQGAALPTPPTPTDHRPLLQSRALRNALVQKVWIEDDVLFKYGQLDGLLRRLRAALATDLDGPPDAQP
ncbi:hypothetical protein [Rubrivirga marina]|uniref:Uncharacterized protein n=1 Tax=Rubrivirga marina TaxID=1196024 RepID=A0A271IW49_9BACT|nr:hypothetical protein [Rubrivirga marina]PAP75443.1 hypothetical protein BSZ37_02775 [Rubrivirga marina]